jgi:hypothetical protein
LPRKNYAVDLSAPGKGPIASRAELAHFLRPTKLLPTDGIVKGCGIGDIRFMLESKDLGGKCADLNALYVGLARAAGIPARDAYGIRVTKSELGYKSLGRRRKTSRKRSIAAPRCTSPAPAGSLSIRRTCGKWSSRNRLETGRWTMRW